MPLPEPPGAWRPTWAKTSAPWNIFTNTDRRQRIELAEKYANEAFDNLTTKNEGTPEYNIALQNYNDKLKLYNDAINTYLREPAPRSGGKRKSSKKRTNKKRGKGKKSLKRRR